MESFAGGQIESPNRRVAILKRWLSKPPKHAAHVRILKLEDPPRVLREIALADIQPGTAHEIDADTREEAAEDGSAVVEFVLAFEAEGGRAITTHRFAVRQAREDDAMNVAAGIEATKDSQIVQLQRFCEVLVRVNATNTQQLMQQMMQQAHQLMEMNRHLCERVSAAYSREDEAREAIHALREHYIDAAADNEQAPSPSDEAVAKAMQVLIPILAQRLLPQAKANTNG